MFGAGTSSCRSPEQGRLVALDSDASAEEQRKLIELTERYCVVYQTLRSSPKLLVSGLA